MPRLRSSSSYSNTYEPKTTDDDFGSRQQRPFFVFMLIVTVTAVIFVLAAAAVLVYVRVRHGPLTLDYFTDKEQDCPGNQIWNECGYTCKLTCEKQFTVCAAMCSPGCECPTQLPIWHQGTCITKELCPLPGENITSSSMDYNYNENSNQPVHESVNVHINQDIPTGTVLDDPPNSDSLQQGGRSQKLNDFMNELWQLNKAIFSGDYVEYDLQGKNNVTSQRDVAPTKFFSEVDQAYFSTKGSSFTSFIELLNCYNKHIKQPDPLSGRKMYAIQQFLDAVVDGEIMKATQVFLNKQGHKNKDSFRQTLFDMWFEQYPRSPRYNITDSCGFEHVFAGEVRGRKITGLHSWIQFYVLEHQQNLNYYGHIHEVYVPYTQKLIAINLKYTWQTHRRKQGSFLLGTSPEFELAMYTVCFILHPNRLCEFDIEGASIHVSTYDVKHISGWQILAAYPIV